MRRLVPHLLLLTAVLVLAPARPALADGGDAALIHACQAPPRGGVAPPPRLVSPDTACRSGETVVHWPATVPPPPTPRPAPVVRDAIDAQVGEYLGMEHLAIFDQNVSVLHYGEAHPLVRLTDGSLAFGALVTSGQLLGTWTGEALRFTEANCQGVAFREVNTVVPPSGIIPLLAPTFAAPGNLRLWAADLTQTPITRSGASVLTFLNPTCVNSASPNVLDTIPFVEVTPPFTPPFRLVIE